MFDLIKEFCMDSSQSVSLDKSVVFFGPRIPRAERTRIQDTMGIQATDQLGKYLGTPLHTKRVSRNTYQCIIQKIQARLTGWQAKHLSLTSRCTLIQSVLASVPSYIMQSAWLPTSTCDSLNKINCQFLWGSTNNHSKLHLVKWAKVTTCKKFGGLNIRESRLANVAQLAKVGGQLAVGVDTLWAKVLSSKYLHANNIMDYEIHSLDSASWKGIVRSLQKVKGGFGWSVGHGTKVSFWFDNWLDRNPLCFLVDDIVINELLWTVHDVLTMDGKLDVDKIQTTVPSVLRARMARFCVQDLSSADSITWKRNATGLLTAHSFYKYLTQSAQLPDPDSWTWVWKLSCPQKIRVFVWLIMHGRLATNVYRARLGLASDDICPSCSIHSETIQHMLRDCPTARQVWESLISPTNATNFFSLPLVPWLKAQAMSAGLMG